MPGDEKETVQPRKLARRGGDSTVGIIILALIVFFFVNGPGSHASDRPSSITETTFSETAVLSGVDRQNNSQAFRGGEASAFMGGIKLDFRDASMEGNEATIGVTDVMGGVELRVPRTWKVVNHATPILGGIEDRTRSTDANKRLIIEGTVVLGGLEISN